MSYLADTLDCQLCGDVLKRLTPAEAQKVADNPNNYIEYCKECRTAIEEELRYLSEGPE